MEAVDAWWNSAYASWQYGDKAWFTLWICLAHTAVAFSVHIPLTIQHFVRWSWLEQYKIQKDVYPTTKVLLEIMLQQTFIHFIMLPAVVYFAFASGAVALGIEPAGPIPPFWRIAAELLAILHIAEFFQYFSHRFMHSNAFIYKWVHAKHHRFTAPNSWASEYATPAELLFGADFSALVGPLILRSNFFTIVLWLIIRTSMTVDVHSGYAFPWSPYNRLSWMFVGSRGHDWHHSHNRGNFGTMLWYMDKLFGTDKEYNKWCIEQEADHDQPDKNGHTQRTKTD